MTDDPHRRTGGYLLVMGVYGGVVGSLTALARLLGRRPPERISPGDVVLLSVATHKLSRLLAKDAVTTPLRAPFTRFEGAAGEAEINESPRTDGQVRHAVGELVTCPFCLAVWVATGLTAGLVFAPRLTRLVAVGATAIAGADCLHLAYDAAKRAGRPDGSVQRTQRPGQPVAPARHSASRT